MTKIAELKKRLMKNPEFRAEYEKADAEFAIIEALVRARVRAKLSQAELAKRIGTTQSAIARLEREGALEAAAVAAAFARLKRLGEGWHEVEPSDGVREAAVRFLRVHQLRAADALQLAAAFVAAERLGAGLIQLARVSG